MGAVFLLAIAATGWYVAARTAISAIAGRAASPGFRALCYSLSSLLVVIISIYSGKPEIAVGVIFAGSVASLTLVLGLAIISANHTRPTVRRGPWSFVLPVALIALLIGFRGGISLPQAGMLLLEGAALLMMWNDLPSARPAGDADQYRAHEPPIVAVTEIGAPAKSNVRTMQMILAVGVAAVASWAGVAATAEVSSSLNITGSGLIAALMLSPALVLSMIGAESHVAAVGKFDQAVSVVVGFVLLQLCALLPLASVLWISQPVWTAPIYKAMGAVRVVSPSAAVSQIPLPTTMPSTQHATTSESAEAVVADEHRPLPYPFAVWRVDTVLIIAVGMFLLPVATGRWSIGKIEGAALIMLYGVYMILTAIMSR